MSDISLIQFEVDISRNPFPVCDEQFTTEELRSTPNNLLSTLFLRDTIRIAILSSRWLGIKEMSISTGRMGLIDPMSLPVLSARVVVRLIHNYPPGSSCQALLEPGYR